MFAYRIRKLLANVLCIFIPNKNGRIILREKIGVGKILAPLKDSNSYVLSDILEKIQATPPLNFIKSYNAIFDDIFTNTISHKYHFAPPR